MTAETTQYQGRTWLTPPNSRYARTSITARKRNARPFLLFGRQLGIHGCVKNDRRAIPLPLVALVPQWRQNYPNSDAALHLVMRVRQSGYRGVNWLSEGGSATCVPTAWGRSRCRVGSAIIRR